MASGSATPQARKPSPSIECGSHRECFRPLPNSHGASEEIFFVLSGSGLAWQDEVVCEVEAGDCVVHRANELEHTFRAGQDGLEYLVYGTKHPTELGWLPRSRAVRLGWPWVEGRTDDPWEVEATAEPLEFAEAGARSQNVVRLAEVPTVDEEGGSWKGLAARGGSRQTGLNWLRLDPGRIGAPPHCHSEEEEVFVVLDGTGTLERWPSPVAEKRGASREDIPLRAGHLVARPPGTRVAHAFRGGPDGMTLLLYGTRRTNDICYYPRSRKLYWRGVGLVGRVESLELMDGEPPD